MVSSVALDRALIVLFEQHRSDEADDGILVGKMPTTSVRRLISPCLVVPRGDRMTLDNHT
jgi:hypothetical protein